MEYAWGVDAVGSTAGRVWQFLEVNGRSSLSAIQRALGVPDSLANMAIGWLAREGKVAIQKERQSVMVALVAE